MSTKNIEDAYNLSPMQQGMLFHSLYAPAYGVYVEQVSALLEGNLDVIAFEQTWQQVVDRHPCLRTAFVWEDLKNPLQVVGRRVQLPIVMHDWQYMTAEEQQQGIQELLQAEQIRGFELSKAPLMRLTLIQLAKTSYQFIWSHHHLLLDGWSTSLLLNEVFAIYEATCQNQTLHLTKPRPYRDYIAWLQQQSLSTAETFWRETLRGFQVATSFSIDTIFNKTNAVSEIAHNEQHINLSTATTNALQALARQHQLTLNTLVQGAWAILLSRYSGETDVVFGTTVSGRPTSLSGSERMVGLFINTLPVRVKIASAQSLLPWLQQLQSQQAEARQYEYTPLVEIQQWSEVTPGSPLFESLIVFENYPLDPQIHKGRGELAISKVQIVEQTNYPVTLVVIPGAELKLNIFSDRYRFEPQAIARMLGHLQTLLADMVSHPEACLQELSLLTAAEKHQLLVEWNQTQVAYPQDVCLHQLFEQQVEKTPNAIAVVFEEQKLTYQELNQHANQLAYRLRKLGVIADTLVGICVERSLEMLVGLLGILKAGGAYLPLEPDYPTERLGFMLEDAKPPILLTQESLISRLPKHSSQVIYLDTDWQEISSSESKENPSAHHQNCSNLAYVIYTSGSTGQPKGVLVNHSNAVRLFATTDEWFNFNQQDVWTLFHSYAFDFSVWEIWGALLYGGRLVVVPYWISRSPDAFYNLLYKEQVTVLNQTPSAFRQLICAEEQASHITKPLALRLVIFGGEALEIHSLKPWFDRHGDQAPQLVNMYGITETTVHVTYRLLTKADLDHTRSLIGRPIPDLQVYLLDQNRQLVPIGVPGEIYVGGAGVAQGYLNRHELTNERFINHSFGSNPTRVYKTGDLARYLPNGDIEYLGRIDQQVKIRGFRIELGEIAAILKQAPGVQQAVVIVREDQPSDRRLIAYVVGHPEFSDNLRDFLKQKLPNYMVPSAIVFLDALPLTSNGKIDRRALPTPEIPLLEPDNQAALPRNPLEETLAKIWAEVLGLSQVGIHDNFFELGGHSLLATQVISKIRRAFQVELPLHRLFDLPTIAALSPEIAKAQNTQKPVIVPTRIARDAHRVKLSSLQPEAKEIQSL